MDLEIRKFKESLVAHINHNKLPEEIKRLVIFEIYKEMSDVADKVVRNQQLAELEAKKQKRGEDIAKSVQSDTLERQTE